VPIKKESEPEVLLFKKAEDEWIAFLFYVYQKSFKGNHYPHDSPKQ
jgi:hypothetical protein